MYGEPSQQESKKSSDGKRISFSEPLEPQLQTLVRENNRSLLGLIDSKDPDLISKPLELCPSQGEFNPIMPEDNRTKKIPVNKSPTEVCHNQTLEAPVLSPS